MGRATHRVPHSVAKASRVLSIIRIKRLVLAATSIVILGAGRFWQLFFPGIPFPLTPEAVVQFLASLIPSLEQIHFIADMLFIMVIVMNVTLRYVLHVQREEPPSRRPDKTRKVHRGGRKVARAQVSISDEDEWPV